MTKRQAVNFMISIAGEYDDGRSVNLTRLAEECAVEFDCPLRAGRSTIPLMRSGIGRSTPPTTTTTT